MSRAEVAHSFAEYAFGFMRADIEREVDLARSGHGGANVQAALGLHHGEGELIDAATYGSAPRIRAAPAVQGEATAPRGSRRFVVRP